MNEKCKGLLRIITVEPFQQDDFAGFRAYLTDIPAVESIDRTWDGALNDLRDVIQEWFNAVIDEMLERRPDRQNRRGNKAK